MDHRMDHRLGMQDVSHLKELCCPATIRGSEVAWACRGGAPEIPSGCTEELLTWGQREFQNSDSV